MAFDFFIYYILALKYTAIGLMVILIVFGIDDLFIDVCYWIRKLWRKCTVYRVNKRMDADLLFDKIEQPIVIMVPVWHEHGIIDKMVDLVVSGLDYENYQIFVGTYPNDPKTQRDVDNLCQQFSHVHKVVCVKSGPTSKADCLNNIIASVIAFEKKAKIEFQGFVIHDSEDVVSAMELRLFNYLLPRKDLIQLPIYPYVRHWYQVTAAHYIDEFAELHGKDIIVREAIAGQVPSAGVGSCFSRRAILRLLVEGEGMPFDIRSLTEDYDIGFRLKEWGMKEIFVRFPVMGKDQQTLKESSFGVSGRESHVICVREYFPITFMAAVRQKTRWIIGIIFQGMKSHKWTKDWKVNYFLWRDRRSAIANFVTFFSMLLFFQIVSLILYSRFVADSYNFHSLLDDNPWMMALLYINLFLFANRSLQRAYFVVQYYGFWQGFLSFPRMIWGNVINFSANLRAIFQVIVQDDLGRIAWDKTTHDFPEIYHSIRRIPIGKLLVNKGAISEEILEKSLLNKPADMLFGTHLVINGYVTNYALSLAIAEQEDADYIFCNPFELDPKIIDLLPKKIALKYSVLPIALEGETLVIVSKKKINPILVNVIRRRIKRPIKWKITTNGAVILGLRYWYFDYNNLDPQPCVEQAIEAGRIDPARAEYLIDYYYATRCQIGDCLIALGFIEHTVLNQAVLAFECTHSVRFGDFLSEYGYVTNMQIQESLDLQNRQEVPIEKLIERFAIGGELDSNG